MLAKETNVNVLSYLLDIIYSFEYKNKIQTYVIY